MRPLALLLLAATVSACSTPFEVELPEEEPRLVIESLFAADSVLTLDVARSEPVQRPSPGGLPSVTNATVLVYEDGVFVGEAPYVETRAHYVSEVRPRAGRTYRVRVEAPGFPPAEAEETVPTPRPFAVAVERGSERTGFEDRIDDVAVRFEDPAGPDYYALYGLSERRFPERPDATQYFPLAFRSADPALADGDLEALLGETDSPFYLRAFFSDRPFDGAWVAIEIRVRRLKDEPESRTETLDRLRLATVSETYYRYQRALTRGQGNPFGEPVRIPSNVEGGYGIFAAFAASEQVLPD